MTRDDHEPRLVIVGQVTTADDEVFPVYKFSTEEPIPLKGIAVKTRDGFIYVTLAPPNRIFHKDLVRPAGIDFDDVESFGDTYTGMYSS